MNISRVTENTTIVSDDRKVNVLWVNAIGAGATTAGSGTIQLQTLNNTALFTINVTATALQVTPGAAYGQTFFDFSRHIGPGFQSSSGLKAVYSTATNVVVEIGYE